MRFFSAVASVAGLKPANHCLTRDVGVSRFVNIFTVVDFPAPFGTKTSNRWCPSLTFKRKPVHRGEIAEAFGEITARDHPTIFAAVCQYVGEWLPLACSSCFASARWLLPLR